MSSAFRILLILAASVTATQRSQTFVTVTSSTGQEQCAVSEPTAVEWLPLNGVVKCGVKCMGLDCCKAYNFNRLTGRCDVYCTVVGAEHYENVAGCTGFVAQNVNECLHHNGGCSVNANCTFNTVDGVTCTCPTGYVGDGFQCIGCPVNFTYVVDVGLRGCYKPVTDLLSWSSASSACQTENSNSHLAFIESLDEQIAIIGLLTDFTLEVCQSRNMSDSECTWWIGAQRIDPSTESEFYWKKTDSTALYPLTYINWEYGQPSFLFVGSMGANESCVVMMEPTTFFQWNDKRCIDAAFYLCEIDLN